MSQAEQTNIQPHILARFTIIKKIGSGAYGHVWKVEDKTNKKIYALKKIFDAFQHSTDAQRTYRQIEILKQIQHPNIIKLYQSIKADNNKDVYLVFQFMQADLHNVIAQGILKEVHIRFIVYQLAKALKYLHSGLIIHRDLKPSNILINSNCTIKLCDFGLVRSLIQINQNSSTLTEGVATRWYRAPEVLLGSTSYSTPTDIWSFGCIIYEILAQKPLFPGESTTDQIHKILNYTGYPSQQQIKSLKSINAKSILKQSKTSNFIQGNKQMLKDLPPMLGQLIARMTKFNPSQRISVDQILNHEAVQPFRKKQQQIQCVKIIMTEVSDNKKLTADQYRNLIYGIKKSQMMMQNNEMKLGAKKSSSATQLNNSYANGQKYVLKYVKSKQLLKTTLNYNKSAQNSSQQEPSIKQKQQTTAQSRKAILKDPTRMSYISKNFYSPKNINLEPTKTTHNYNSMSNINSSMSYAVNHHNYSNSTHSYITQPTSAHNAYHGPSMNMSSSNPRSPTSVLSGAKTSSYTTLSAYTGQKKPILFKSSKYMINKTQESGKQ